ncbi:MAG: preprotein translocase subunit SecA [Anaerorhabdus sp.]
MANFIDKIFNFDAKQLGVLEKKAQKVDALSQEYGAMSDETLKSQTQVLRDRLAKGESLDEILPEAFATVREAAKRVIGEYPYFVQLVGAVAMQGGDIAEMKTGEGKTLTSILAVYLNALEGKGVHVVTVNEYLASRDAEWMGEIHRFLGLTVGLNLRQLDPSQKRAAYACDITYSTNSELGFDYLRDNMVVRKEDRVLRGLHFALVDEVDSILIDESRTPLIISGGKKQTANLYKEADRFVKGLSKEDYEIDIKGKTIQLTENGVQKAEKTFKVNNLYEIDHTQLVHHLSQALRANHIMLKDIEYVVQDGEIIIVDQNTGRLMKGRAYSDGLHQAIEAKESVEIKQETTTLATITYQNFFRLYNKLAGMTGTAKTEEEEFLSIYNMRVVVIPTNRPIQRQDYPDAIYGTKKAKFEALVKEVMECHDRGQPVLVGTIAVETSEHISMMLKSRKVKHEILNAKNHEREAEIIQRAGREGAVTIATNMAGRGTDIKLAEGILELGGLAVLGSERHESRRIDNQLRGRSGRQGDPGYSRFYVSIEDELMQRFGSDKVMSGLFARMGDEAIESKAVTRSIGSAQQRVEGHNFDARKNLLQYDDVLRQQREIMYDQRNYILDHEDVHSVVHEMFDRVVSNLVDAHTDDTERGGRVNSLEVLENLEKMGFKDSLTEADLNGKTAAEAKAICVDAAWKSYEDKIEKVKDKVLPIEKNMVLRVIDRAWVNHIDVMSKLRDGIGLRSYAQANPLQAYVQEGFEMFEEMMGRIAQEIVTFCLNVKVVVEERKVK